MKKPKMTPVVTMHYIKLFLRGSLFLAALVTYIIHAVTGTGSAFGGFEKDPVLIGIIWLFFMADMLLRFFPNKLESPGCQKQFLENFIPIPENEPKLQKGLVTFAVFAAWVALNAIFGALYYAGIFDKGILLLIALAYSVCDIICILFFCPFQTWMMKNKCCGSCRIYNWDYAMMFTPLVFIPHYYTWSLLGIALLLLAVWEITAHLHPERFSEHCNQSLHCGNCREKLCHHKTQLRHFLRTNKEALLLKGNALLDKAKRKGGGDNA